MSTTQKVPEVSEPSSDSSEVTPSQQRHRFKLFQRRGSGLKLFRRPSRSPPSPSGHYPTAQPHSSSSETTTSQTPQSELPTAYSQLDISSLDAMALSRLVLRVSVQRGRHLAANVEENSINPYAILSCAGRRQRTQVVRKTENPDWECTFDVCLAGTGSRSSRKRQQILLTNGLVLTVCTKDRFKSVIIGQVHIPIEDIFQEDDTVAYDASNNEAKWYPLREAGQRRRRRRRRQFRLRRKRAASQQQQQQTDLSENESHTFQDIFGRVEMKIGLVYQPDKSDDSAAVDDVPGEEKMRELWKLFLDSMRLQYGLNVTETADESSSSLPSDVDNLRITPSESCPENMQDLKQRSRRRRFRRRRQSNSASPKAAADGTTRRRRRIVPRRLRRRTSRSAQVARFYSDVVGVMFLEVSHANDLPPERNMTRTGFDMDPFVIISYGTHTFRTRTVRHNLNPTWNEKLYFHVRRHEGNYKLKFAIYDHDRLSNNDYVAWREVPIMDIIKESHDTTEKIIATEIPAETIEADMGLHTVALEMVNKSKWQDKLYPTLTFRAKFVPYPEMRKMFWVALAKTYDIDGDGSLSRLEVQSMLESLGSTISEHTLNGFWSHYGKDPETDELTMEELVESLESFMLSIDRAPTPAMRIPSRELISVDGHGDAAADSSSSSSSDAEDTESIQSDDFENVEPGLTDDDEDEYYSLVYDDDDDDDEVEPMASSGSPSDDADMDEILEEAKGVQYAGVSSQQRPLEGTLTPSNEEGHRREDHSNEKVIRLAECPICHRPNLSRRAQMDIVTHVATCAANDWTTVDRFIMGNFVTEAYAQRRWFVKLVSKVGYGRYQLGRDNANIIVQDRLSGQLIEERMSVYVRLGMRLLYKGMKTGIQSKTAQRILTNLTIKQGKKYDSPLSAREILPFIKFHKLDMSEVLEPIENFKTFNQFFYRKLKPGARPCEHPDNPRVIVSPADCRMMAFDTIDDATRLWIKGLEFSVDKLLGNEEKAKAFYGGSLGIFRLAPQDYHRFHSPVDGVITEITYISGNYYTVNPMAIRTTLDVYGENARAIVHMDTDEFGKVAVVCVGAMMVGSIILTAKMGDRLARTDELGYFAFGGSTLVVLWEKDTMTFDDDLLENSKKALETLVRVGNRIATFVKEDK